MKCRIPMVVLPLRYTAKRLHKKSFGSVNSENAGRKNMKSYIVKIIKLSRKVNISLLKAWKHSGVDLSTYYRAINGAEVKHSTAQKVEDAIYSLQKASKSNRKLAEDYRRFKKVSK